MDFSPEAMRQDILAALHSNKNKATKANVTKLAHMKTFMQPIKSKP